MLFRSSLDAVAWNVWADGECGTLAVVADAMRKEVYPVRYRLDDAGAHRLEADRVVKAVLAAEELSGDEGSLAALLLAGDGLFKYASEFTVCGSAVDEELWTPTGRGLLLALQTAWRSGEVDPFDVARHNPAYVLPVYTRLSDAEENERIRLAKNDPKNLVTGVQDVEEAAHLRQDQRTTMHDTAILNARADEAGVTYKPLDAAHVDDVAAMEAQVMGTDAWSVALVLDELPRTDRSWWYAEVDDRLVGYAGGWIVDGDVQILKIGVDPHWRRHGIARKLLARVVEDARDLGAQSCSLEVRASNEGAQRFYEQAGLTTLGRRPRYYSDGEDAFIMQGPLPVLERDVAGMMLAVNNARSTQISPHVSRETPQGCEGLSAGENGFGGVGVEEIGRAHV